MPTKIDRNSLVKYYQANINIALQRLAASGQKITSLAQAQPLMRQLASHPNLDRLTLNVPAGSVKFIDVRQTDPASLEQAKKVLLAGRVFNEEAFAGDATRIKKDDKGNPLPPGKYVMHDSKFFYTAKDLIKQANTVNLDLAADLKDDKAFMPMILGSLHLYKAAYEIYSLAKKSGKSDSEARESLKSQYRTVVLPEKYWEEAVNEIIDNNYYGFDPEKIMFLIQAQLPGFSLTDGQAVSDPSAPPKIWNHGSIKMQSAVPGEIFKAFRHTDGSIIRQTVEEAELQKIFARMDDAVSYNIEDMALIRTGEVADLTMIGVALAHKQQGCKFLMEIVAQNQANPQKGGFLAFDPETARPLMLETSMSGSLIDSSLKGQALEEQLRKISYINRNFNHTMDLPYIFQQIRLGLKAAETGTLSALKPEERLLGYTHAEVKDGFLYPQPPQGDINLFVPTVFIGRDPLPQIEGLKVLGNIPMALSALYQGSRQSGLAEFIATVKAKQI